MNLVLVAAPSTDDDFAEAALSPEDQDDVRIGLLAPAISVVQKHLGPGPHPNGSPQSVHSGRGTLVGRQRPLLERQRTWMAGQREARRTDALYRARKMDEGIGDGQMDPEYKTVEVVKSLHARGIDLDLKYAKGVQEALHGTVGALDTLSEIGIDINPQRINIGFDNYALASVHENGTLYIHAENLWANRNRIPPEGLKFGDNSPFQTIIHEVGHLVDLRSDLSGDDLHAEFGDFDNSRYGNITTRGKYQVLGINLGPFGDRPEYFAEAFTAAVLTELGMNGPWQEVDPRLRAKVLAEARRYG